MAKKPFTDEEVRILLANPYTAKVTTTYISFTKEFKELFWKDYCSGLPAKTILHQYGYDPEIFGDIRIRGIVYNLAKKRLKDPANELKPRSCVSVNPDDSAAAIKQLEHEVQYLRQEVEFLKKISSIKISKEQRKS